MTYEAKILLLRSLSEYKKLDEPRKVKMVKLVNQRLEQHNNALKTIGIGYADNFAQAGRIFLRIIKNCK